MQALKSKATRGLVKADDGTTVDPNDPTGLLAQQHEDKLTTDQLTLLGHLAQLSGQNKPTQGVAVASPIDPILTAQESRAKTMAGGYAPGAKYLDGMQPGGLADVLGSTAAAHGGKAPKGLPDANRQVNRVALDSLGSSFADALGMADQVQSRTKMIGGLPGEGGTYTDTINQIIDSLTKRTQPTAKPGAKYNGDSAPQGRLDMDKFQTQPRQQIKPPTLPGAEAPAPKRAPAPVPPVVAQGNASQSKAPTRTQSPNDASAQALLDQILGGGQRETVGPTGITPGGDVLGYLQGLGSEGLKKLSALFGSVPGPKAGTGSANQRYTGMPKKADGGEPEGGAQLLHVGERKAGDKNYETSEVVFAPPGTVVAPIPKGMKPTPENAMALIVKQVMTDHAKKMPQTEDDVEGAAGGDMVGDPSAQMPTEQSGVSSPNDPYSYLSSLQAYLTSQNQYELGTQTNETNRQRNNQLGQYEQGQLANQAGANANQAASIREQGLLGANTVKNDATKNANDLLKINNDYKLGTAANETNNMKLAFDRIMAGITGSRGGSGAPGIGMAP